MYDSNSNILSSYPPPQRDGTNHRPGSRNSQPGTASQAITPGSNLFHTPTYFDVSQGSSSRQITVPNAPRRPAAGSYNAQSLAATQNHAQSRTDSNELTFEKFKQLIASPSQTSSNVSHHSSTQLTLSSESEQHQDLINRLLDDLSYDLKQDKNSRDLEQDNYTNLVSDLKADIEMLKYSNWQLPSFNF